ncbi:MAG: hypothetical protein FVQ77_06270 [Cytophagales bacterium]|nr:hypothetical protein [Cytophagales bacterium]
MSTTIFRAKEIIEESLLGNTTDSFNGFLGESLQKSYQNIYGSCNIDEFELSTSLTGVGIVENALEVTLDNRIIPNAVCKYFKVHLSKKLNVNARQLNVFSTQKLQAYTSLRIGDKVGHQDLVNYGGYGTLGSFILSSKKDKRAFIFSNNHVLANTNQGKEGDLIYKIDERKIIDIGTLTGYIPLKKNQINSVDLAIGELDNYGELVFYLSSDLRYRKALIDERVFKVGATTATTHGRIRSLDYTQKVSYDFFDAVFTDQIQIVSENRNPFSQPGDSGSAIFSIEDRSFVGILFAGNNQFTLANHSSSISKVIKKWHLKL